MWTKIEVGQPFLLPNPGVRNGAVLEAARGGGLMLLIYLESMTQTEADTLRKDKIAVRAYREQDKLLLLFRFGPELIFEVSFNPRRYSDERSNAVGKSNLLHIVGIESSSNIVRLQRVVSISARLLAMMERYWGEQSQVTPEKYDAWLERLTQCSVDELWEQGEYIGQLVFS